MAKTFTLTRIKNLFLLCLVRQLQWKTWKTPPHVDRRRTETEAQTTEEERTHLCLSAAIQMLWNEYKYNNYMTYNSSTMLYASYTILLGGLQTCCVGSEKDHRVCLVSVCPLSSASTSVHCVHFVQRWVSYQPGTFLQQTSSWRARSGTLARPARCHSLTGCCLRW